MSINAPVEIPCPACEALVPVEVAFSINGGRHPHFRQAILNNSYQRYTCSHCGEGFRLAPELTYFDASRSVWLLVRPHEELDGWDEVEDGARVIFEKAFGPKTPPQAQELGEGLTVRVVFGWPAFREKLAAADAGLNDVDLELVKLALIRTAGSTPVADKVELRLLGLKDDELVFLWLNPDTEQVVESLQAPKKLYDDIAADDAWNDLRDDLQAGVFVDLDRLLVEPVPI